MKQISDSVTVNQKQARRQKLTSVDLSFGMIDLLEDRVVLATDFGDAPDSSVNTGKNDYQTIASNNGPRHTIDSTKTTLFLGASVDGDLGLSQSRAAVLDDLFSADFWITDYTNKTVIREPRYFQLEYDLKSKLSPGEYHAYVRVVTSDGQFLRWGQPRQFTIDDEVWPYLTVPASFQASEQERLIDWQDIPGASFYEIWITNERFVRIVHQTQIESSSFDLRSSLGVGRYRVWVRALNGLGITGGGAVPRSSRSFNVLVADII